MKKILIIASAARVGGALSILKDILHQARNTPHYYSVIIDPSITNHLPSSKNINYIIIDTTSWIKRIYYDFFGYKKLLSKEHFDICLNLQNIPSRINIEKQFIYYHQPLPLSEYHFSLFKKNEIKYWAYKNLYLFFIYINKKHAYKFIVQTKWVKEKLSKKLGLKNDLIYIIYPKIEFPKEIICNYDDDNTMFYPASSFPYKNHIILIEALNQLPLDFLIKNKIKLYLTLSPDDNPELYDKVKQYNLMDIVIFLGNLNKNDVFSFYRKSKVLVFPSYLETYGLPLAEAMHYGCYIIALDQSFSREILDGYKNKILCTNNVDEWAKEIESIVSKKRMPNNTIQLNKLSEKNIIDIILK